MLSSNKKIIQEYLPKKCKIGFIPTASELDEDRWYMKKDKEELINMQYDIIEIDITNENKDNILTKLNQVDALFVAGGNCFYLLQQIKLKDILNDIIKFAQEKIYIGSSAGSCIACPSISYVEKFDDKKEAPLLEDYNALNLIDAYILPHYNSDEKYTDLIKEILSENKKLNYITLQNDEALIVNSRNDYHKLYTE